MAKAPERSFEVLPGFGGTLTNLSAANKRRIEDLLTRLNIFGAWPDKAYT